MNNIFKQRPGKLLGFSFIELLVVIAIIGLLGTISAVAFSSVRSKEVDTRRVTDMKKISFALERYHLVNGKYPLCPDAKNCDYYDDDRGWYTCLGVALEPFIGKIPVDPVRKDDVGYCYTINSSSPNQYASNEIILQYHLDSYVSTTSVGANSYESPSPGVHLYNIIIQPYVN